MLVPMPIDKPRKAIADVKRGERYAVLATDVIGGSAAAWVEHIDKETLLFETSDGTRITGSDYEVLEAFKAWLKAAQEEFERLG